MFSRRLPLTKTGFSQGLGKGDTTWSFGEGDLLVKSGFIKVLGRGDREVSFFLVDLLTEMGIDYFPR